MLFFVFIFASFVLNHTIYSMEKQLTFDGFIKKNSSILNTKDGKRVFCNLTNHIHETFTYLDYSTMAHQIAIHAIKKYSDQKVFTQNNELFFFSHIHDFNPNAKEIYFAPLSEEEVQKILLINS